MAGKENIIEDFYGFIKYLLPIINKFPREQKFILGERLSSYLLQIHELYIEAYYGQKQTKKENLHKVNVKLEQLRYLVRLAYDMRYINKKRYGYISEQLMEIGKKTGGWLKTLS